MVTALIKFHADINKANQDGDTPLHVASRKGHEEVIMALITAKADIKKVNKAGQTPLQLAKLNHHQKIVELLEKLENEQH